MAVQRTGATGIIKGFGKSAGWENKTFFYPDSTISIHEFEKGIKDFNAKYKIKPEGTELLTIKQAMHIIVSNAGLFYGKTLLDRGGFRSGYFFDERFWKDDLHLSDFDPERNITRYELAVLLDHFTNAFSAAPVNMKGL